MRTTSLASRLSYRSLFGEERRSDLVLIVVLLAVFWAALALYDAYAEGRWGGRDRTLAIPTLMEPIAVSAADLGPSKAQPIVSDADALRAAVQRANVAFADARAWGDASPLLSIAAGDWLAQEQAYIAQMRARGQTERWQLLGLDFVQVEVRPDGTGFVCTSERWQVQTVSSDGTVLSTRTVSYSEGYILVRGGSDWLVTRIDIG
ncbi:MAG: hypothetical protein DIU80_018785 [Chloroflexota bacterium]